MERDEVLKYLHQQAEEIKEKKANQLYNISIDEFIKTHRQKARRQRHD